MTRTNTPTVDEYWEALAKHLPTFSPEDQRVAVTLYRELAKGQPVDAAQLGRALGVAPAAARGFLNRDSIKAFVYPDDKGRVLGFGGLAAAPMHHRLEVDGRTLWTWCAWDSLFISGDLGEAGARRVARPGYRRARPTRRDARRDRVCRTAERRRLVPVAGRARLRHVRR